MLHLLHDLGRFSVGGFLGLAMADELVGRAGCVVDLSAAYRLKDAALYQQWYGFEHDQPELLAEAVYAETAKRLPDIAGGLSADDQRELG